MALWVFVYLGTTPIGSIVTGWIIATGGPPGGPARFGGVLRCGGAGSAFVVTPPNPDEALTDLAR
jgi:hypothetical protein